jgi:hypothetical protein
MSFVDSRSSDVASTQERHGLPIATPTSVDVSWKSASPIFCSSSAPRMKPSSVGRPIFCGNSSLASVDSRGADSADGWSAGGFTASTDVIVMPYVASRSGNALRSVCSTVAPLSLACWSSRCDVSTL